MLRPSLSRKEKRMRVSEIMRAKTTPVVVIDPRTETLDTGENAIKTYADREVGGLWINAGKLVIVVEA